MLRHWANYSKRIKKYNRFKIWFQNRRAKFRRSEKNVNSTEQRKDSILSLNKNISSEQESDISVFNLFNKSTSKYFASDSTNLLITTASSTNISKNDQQTVEFKNLSNQNAINYKENFNFKTIEYSYSSYGVNNNYLYSNLNNTQYQNFYTNNQEKSQVNQQFFSSQAQQNSFQMFNQQTNYLSTDISNRGQVLVVSPEPIIRENFYFEDLNTVIQPANLSPDIEYWPDIDDTNGLSSSHDNSNFGSLDSELLNF